MADGWRRILRHAVDVRGWREVFRLRDVSLLDWTLGSFHAAVLLVVALLALHLTDSLAGALDAGGTIVGGALYLALLASTVVTARLIVAQTGLDETGAHRGGLRETLGTVGWGILGGAVNGLLFLLVLAVVIFVGLLVTEPSDVVVLPFVLAFGTPVALAGGLVLGGAFVLVDLLLLWVVDSLVPGERAPEGSVDEPAT